MTSKQSGCKRFKSPCGFSMQDEMINHKSQKLNRESYSSTPITMRAPISKCILHKVFTYEHFENSLRNHAIPQSSLQNVTKFHTKDVKVVLRLKCNDSGIFY